MTEGETETQRETETERGGKGVAFIVLSQIEDRLKVIWLWVVSFFVFVFCLYFWCCCFWLSEQKRQIKGRYQE